MNLSILGPENGYIGALDYLVQGEPMPPLPALLRCSSCRACWESAAPSVLSTVPYTCGFCGHRGAAWPGEDWRLVEALT